MHIICQASVVAKETFLNLRTGNFIADWMPEVRQREIDLLNQPRETKAEAVRVDGCSLFISDRRGRGVI